GGARPEGHPAAARQVGAGLRPAGDADDASGLSPAQHRGEARGLGRSAGDKGTPEGDVMIVDPLTLAAFVPAALALNLTPGADMMFCLAQGMRGGPRPAVAEIGRAHV